MPKSTIVSALPFPLNEEKPGLYPSIYQIPAAAVGDIAVKIIDDGFHHVVIPLSDEKVPPMKIIDPSGLICEGLITDYIGASLGISYDNREDGSQALPGLFWVEGNLTKDLIKFNHKEKISKALANTRSWFMNLVMIADDDWNKFKQHKFVSDLQRQACNWLGLEREWNFITQISSMTFCWSCKVQVHPSAIMCNQCHAIINMELYEKNKHMYVGSAVKQ